MTFIVNSTSSSLAEVGSLAYALSAANANPGPDVVIIDLPPEAANLIMLTAELPMLAAPIDIRGGGVTISGAQLSGSFSVGLFLGIGASNSSVTNVTFTDFPGAGALWAASDGRMSNVTIFGCGSDGLQLDGHRNVISISFIGNVTIAGSRGNGKNGFID